MDEIIDEGAADAEALHEHKVNVAKKNWKDSLMFGKTRDMPSPDWKKKKK